MNHNSQNNNKIKLAKLLSGIRTVACKYNTGQQLGSIGPKITIRIRITG